MWRGNLATVDELSHSATEPENKNYVDWAYSARRVFTACRVCRYAAKSSQHIRRFPPSVLPWGNIALAHRQGEAGTLESSTRPTFKPEFPALAHSRWYFWARLKILGSRVGRTTASPPAFEAPRNAKHPMAYLMAPASTTGNHARSHGSSTLSLLNALAFGPRKLRPFQVSTVQGLKPVWVA